MTDQRYELSYTLSTDVCIHERWLINWALEWIDDENVTQLRVFRDEQTNTTQFEILVDVTNGEAAKQSLEGQRYLLECLEETVDTFEIVRHRNGSTDRSIFES
ncbi:hypothetical protein OB955_14440 [Halobacteria archaeon AArc-m2/3/4]|uniref:Uncharacterized protein n=1 Tax=Natronoglomus mannanivorans TaxID=2979990 RepID=A0ABT2QG89_9EURY|nr:hypothetical protein [Halobacteria archaeon AArc-m2/3/4]